MATELDMEAISAAAPFQIVTTMDDGTQGIAKAMSAASASRFYEARLPALGMQNRYGQTFVCVSLQERRDDGEFHTVEEMEA